MRAARRRASGACSQYQGHDHPKDDQSEQQRADRFGNMDGLADSCEQEQTGKNHDHKKFITPAELCRMGEAAGLLVRAYTIDPALIAIAGPALVLATLFFVADGIQVVAAQANRAAGDVWWPTIMHFAAYSLIMMPLGWWLAHKLGVNGLVWAVILASLVSSVLLTGRFVRVARRLPV